VVSFFISAQATPHDDAHNAFMMLPSYTGSKEGEACQPANGRKPYRAGLGVKKCSPRYSNMLVHHNIAITFPQIVPGNVGRQFAL
jgi:hypothetical protein